MDIKHLRHEEASSSVKASKTRLMSEAEARRKEKPHELATKKMQAVLEETSGTEPETAANDFKIDIKQLQEMPCEQSLIGARTKRNSTKKVKLKLELELRVNSTPLKHPWGKKQSHRAVSG